MKMMMMIRW